MEPTVLQDSREQLPLDLTYPVEIVGLPCGDYGVRGFSDWGNPAFIVERKSLDDLIGSLTSGRERFWKECLKLRQFAFRAILIEAYPGEVEMHQYRSRCLPQSVFGSLAALQVRMGLHVIWAGDRDRAARELERLVRVFCSGISKDWKRLQAAETETAKAILPVAS